MLIKKAKTWLIGVSMGAIALVTAVSCDPYYGLDFFRDDDEGEYYDDYYYGDYYYDDYYYDCYDCY